MCLGRAFCLVRAAVCLALWFARLSCLAVSGSEHSAGHFYILRQKVPVALQLRSLCVTGVRECCDNVHAVIFQNKSSVECLCDLTATCQRSESLFYFQHTDGPPHAHAGSFVLSLNHHKHNGHILLLYSCSARQTPTALLYIKIYRLIRQNNKNKPVNYLYKSID